MVNSLPKHKVPTSVYKARLQLSLARTVFCQGIYCCKFGWVDKRLDAVRGKKNTEKCMEN